MYIDTKQRKGAEKMVSGILYICMASELFSMICSRLSGCASVDVVSEPRIHP